MPDDLLGDLPLITDAHSLVEEARVMPARAAQFGSIKLRAHVTYYGSLRPLLKHRPMIIDQFTSHYCCLSLPIGHSAHRGTLENRRSLVQGVLDGLLYQR